jgi:hypothetical protein
VSLAELTEKRGGRGWPRSHIIRPRENMVLFELFNTLCSAANNSKKGTIEIQNPNSQEYLRLATNVQELKGQ